MAAEPDPNEEMASYQPFGGDDWMYEPCLNGDLILEISWKTTVGLYDSVEVGEGPDSWGI